MAHPEWFHGQNELTAGTHLNRVGVATSSCVHSAQVSTRTKLTPKMRLQWREGLETAMTITNLRAKTSNDWTPLRSCSALNMTHRCLAVLTVTTTGRDPVGNIHPSGGIVLAAKENHREYKKNEGHDLDVSEHTEFRRHAT